MYNLIIIGLESFKSVRIISLCHGVKHGTRIILVVLIAIFIPLIFHYLTHISKAAGTIFLKEIDVVRVNTTVNNSSYHSLTCVSLWKVCALVNLVNANLLAYKVHFLVQTAWELHSANAFQISNTLNIG